MTVIATAGHVDHGKSTFVNFLTKQETDRLPEEKKRGLTINLGYTYFSYENKTYSIVDVPGHKDYFKNTVSGFSNADVIFFIIDSTENWSEQSEEHFQALIALKKRNFLFIYTKTDLLKDGIDKKILLSKIEAFPDIHSLVHSIMLQGSKCKQSLERENGEKLVSLVNEFSEIFWKTKEVETSRVTAPYPPALEMVVPNLS